MKTATKLASGLLLSGIACSAAVNAASPYENGLLVPWATYDSASQSTAVGLMTCAAGTVYWTFYNANGAAVSNGSISMDANDMESFIWASEGSGLGGTDGYMTFSLDTDGDKSIDSGDSNCLQGNAFYLDLTNNDVKFIPTVPLADSDYSFGSGEDLENMGDTTIANLSNAVTSSVIFPSVVDMRYYVDGSSGGKDTTIVVWSTGDVSATFSTTVYDDDGNSESMNLTMSQSHQNLIDPESLSLPSGYTDGFIAWTTSSDVISFSAVEDDSIGAAQTLINPDRPAPIWIPPIVDIPVVIIPSP